MKFIPGQKAPLFAVQDIFGNTVNLAQIQNQKIILSFFRYATCPMCNVQIAKIMQQKEYFEKNNLKVIAVFESSAESLMEYIVDRHDFHFTILADPNRELYRMYGVKPSWLKTLKTLSLKGLENILLALKKGYKIISKVEGTVNQIPADFLIDEDKIIRIAHYGDSVVDHYPLENFLRWDSL